MSLFAKYVSVLCAGPVLCAGFFVAMVWPGRADDRQPSKAATKDSGAKKDKVAKVEETPAPKKTEVPVIKGHPSYGMWIPYFSTDGKRQMNFKIGVATRIDDNHVDLKDMQIETFDENEEHEMAIDLPSSVLDTDTNVIITHHHVTIRREDFELTGEAMIFNTRTKQGGLGGNVHMIIYDLKSETSEGSDTPDPASAAKTPEPKKK